MIINMISKKCITNTWENITERWSWWSSSRRYLKSLFFMSFSSCSCLYFLNFLISSYCHFASGQFLCLFLDEFVPGGWLHNLSLILEFRWLMRAPRDSLLLGRVLYHHWFSFLDVFNMRREFWKRMMFWFFERWLYFHFYYYSRITYSFKPQNLKLKFYFSSTL